MCAVNWSRSYLNTNLVFKMFANDQYDYKWDSTRLLKHGFDYSEILDLQIFTNIHTNFNVKTQDGITTIGGHTIQKLRDTINERQFVLKMHPVQNLKQILSKMNMSHEEVINAEKYIRIPNLNRYMDGTFFLGWTMFGLTTDEIRKALVQYREREYHFDPKFKIIGNLYEIPMYTDLLKVHREKERTSKRI